MYYGKQMSRRLHVVKYAARRYDDDCHVSRPLSLLNARSWLRMPIRLLHVLPQRRHMYRRSVMLMMSHYELHEDELAWWHDYYAYMNRY